MVPVTGTDVAGTAAPAAGVVIVSVGKAMSGAVNHTVMNELTGPFTVMTSVPVESMVTGVLVSEPTVFLSSLVLTIVVPLSVIEPLVTRCVPLAAPLVT
jgi:hypothetical protein